MTYQEIQDRVVSTFWSAGLRAEIARRNYVFPARDLMAAVYHTIDNYEERMELLRLFADHVPEVADHAKAILDWQEKSLADFRVLNPGETYELRITDRPGEEHMGYLCTDFDACFDLIDRYYERYDWIKESPLSDYYIVKRGIFSSGKTVEGDELGSVDLLPGKRIERIWYGDKSELADCTGECCKCHQNCIDLTEPEYPFFLPNRSPVVYRLNDGTIHHGIIIDEMSMASLVYIIPLDGEMLSTRDYSHFCIDHEHEHIPVPDVDAVGLEELPHDLHENYLAFLKFLEES